MPEVQVGGSFVEIGSNDPVFIDNTFMLERAFDWRGLMVEFLPQFEEPYKPIRSSSSHLIGDAMRVDYVAELSRLGVGKNIDYLQVDLEWESSLEALELLDREVMDDYRFAVITFEHDHKSKPLREPVRTRSREILLNRGYVPVFMDVANLAGRPYEDWYVHPALVDMEHVDFIISNDSLVWKEIAMRIQNAISAAEKSAAEGLAATVRQAWSNRSGYLKLPPRVALAMAKEPRVGTLYRRAGIAVFCHHWWR